MRHRTVVMNDKMQKGYRYVRTAPVGRNFDLTDTRKEFPWSWFIRAKLRPRRRDRSLNFFGVDASQPLSVWCDKGWINPEDPAWLVPVVLPLLHGPPPARRRPATVPAMEGDPPARAANRAALRAGRPGLPPATAAGKPGRETQAISIICSEPRHKTNIGQPSATRFRMR